MKHEILQKKLQKNIQRALSKMKEVSSNLDLNWNCIFILLNNGAVACQLFHKSNGYDPKTECFNFGRTKNGNMVSQAIVTSEELWSFKDGTLIKLFTNEYFILLPGHF